MGESGYQHDFNMGMDNGQALIFTLIYVFTGSLFLVLDLLVNGNNYEIPTINQIVITLSTGMLILCLNLVITRFTGPGRRLSALLKAMLSNVSFFHALLLVVVGAVAEEIVFRGFFMGILMRFTGPVVSVLLTSAVFGAMHGFFRPPFVLWSFIALVYGLVLGYLLVCTGSVFAPVLLHVIINTGGILFLKFDMA